MNERYPHPEFPQDAGPRPWWWDKDDERHHKMRKDYLRRHHAKEEARRQPEEVQEGRRFPLQKFPGGFLGKPPWWDKDNKWAHRARERYIVRYEAARQRAKEQRERRWKESEEYRRLERKREITRLVFNPFASAKTAFLTKAGVGVTPAASEKLGTLFVEGDTDDARYPSIPDILAAEPAGEEDVCLRFGEPPADGKSRKLPYWAEYENHKEVGVSTFSGKLTARGNYLINCQHAVLRGYIVLMVSEGRPVFFCRGRCIKRREGGEWILRNPALEPVPTNAVVAIKDSPSRELERWLSRRGVNLGEWVAQHG